MSDDSSSSSSKIQKIESKYVSAKPEKVICVFCGSSAGNSPEYVEQAKLIGKLIAEKNYGLVYGGGDVGIMGAVSKTVVDNNGYVHGIIPQALFDKERNADILDGKFGHTTVVNDMHTRKRMMAQEANAFVTLPGGYGTLEELAEVITWSQLGIHNKPVIVYNINGFFDHLRKFFNECVESGFIKKGQKEIVIFADTAEEVIQQIDNYKIPEARYNLNWDIQ